jgi:hypothetical protein
MGRHTLSLTDEMFRDFENCAKMAGGDRKK